jgi:hypothetical protein
VSQNFLKSHDIDAQEPHIRFQRVAESVPLDSLSRDARHLDRKSNDLLLENVWRHWNLSVLTQFFTVSFDMPYIISGASDPINSLAQNPGGKAWSAKVCFGIGAIF